MKKILRNKEIVKATRKFTDRELPRKVFWDKYNLMKENISNLEDIYVITYYGLGGIGKSRLLRQIIEELKENEKKPYYILYDFETSQDTRAVLSMIKNKAEKDYNFVFPRFDLAMYTYARKIGESAEKPEVKSIIEQSRALSFIMDGLGELTAIPVVGIASKIIKLADSGLAVIKNTNERYKADLIKMEEETAEETYLRLPYYFSQDLADNVEKLDKPFVILLDTYEKLVNEVKDEGYSLMKDLWLRNEQGPILQVPGVLWVIAGREKIKWGEYDKDWEETLDQHILGDLSFDDTDNFLKESGIAEKELREDIFKLTNGTPVYLDICVGTYEILKEKNEEITIDKFGINVEELIERYIRYMDSQTSELVYLLSIIENWNDKLIENVAYKILPNFSITMYERIKKLSFIFGEEDNYYIHKTVKEIFKKECPKTIKEKAEKVLEDYYFNFIKNESMLDKKIMNYVNSYIELALNSISKENAEEQISKIDIVLKCLERACMFYELNEITTIVYNKLNSKYDECKNFYLIKLQYIKVIRRQENKDYLQELKNISKYIIENKILDIYAFEDIASSFSGEKIELIKDDAVRLLNYINSYSEDTIKDNSIYHVKGILYALLGNLDESIKMYEKFGEKNKLIEHKIDMSDINEEKNKFLDKVSQNDMDVVDILRMQMEVMKSGNVEEIKAAMDVLNEILDIVIEKICNEKIKDEDLKILIDLFEKILRQFFNDKNFEEALRITKILYNIYEALYGLSDERTVRIILMVAKCYEELKNYVDEIIFLLESYEKIRISNNNEDNESSIEILIFATNVFVLNKDIDNAKKFSRETYNLLKIWNLNYENRNQIRYINNLIYTFIECNMKKEAEDLINEILPVAEKILDKDDKLYKKLIEKSEKIKNMK